MSSRHRSSKARRRKRGRLIPIIHPTASGIDVGATEVYVIDGLQKRIDDDAYTIRFTPRRPGSTWSRRDVERYEAMEAAGLVEPAGEAAWEARTEENSGVYSFEQDEPPTPPEAYVERLRANAAAWADWESRPPGYRRTVTHWVTSAKREETRQRRLAALIEDSAAGRKVKPLR